eukprot:jgi/Psemu1/303662/fgenesh1_kg.116_\
MSPNNCSINNSKNSADQAFVSSFTPEFIAQQERMLKQIEARNNKAGRLPSGTGVTKTMDTRSLAIRHAVYC